MHDQTTTPSTTHEIARLREHIDDVDARLAELLEQRALIAARVQRLKPVGYFAGRDMDRERRLVERMARHAPRLGADRLAAIMDSVISAGLAAAEEEATRQHRP
ncbi:chorismate mutase [Nocardiopsis lambiniae]|uniref:Chorismate mutase n=1 Tax=Nocardiopsis lambiniae TaxID=3075539 RepID=A0ABU2MCN4_9ACTN|nr:chorismate mutase [Nocardiopsis sp. DSM 44743]MDT0330451.1 chorismate mutase [Nocardiopsis sp. DSM 44743]